MLRIHDAILHTISFSLLLAGIMAIDKDVRGHVVKIVAGDSATELAIIAAPAYQLGRLAVDTLSDYRTENPELVVFAVAAVVLFALMFRS
jgi:hypothetical protein